MEQASDNNAEDVQRHQRQHRVDGAFMPGAAHTRGP
ncbi:hypothetical protein SAMN05192548_101738 [Paraburkholderia terricola]|uniref:Uncharacterized protein n=1 Tax=Paraburkholderia terricola TaxID=169427 RepID=A0A1M6QZW5_9BURK|nr:hypothetical protein SAMN05192547_101638 [Paraburkholderia sediminicola]SHK25781.1 hypothetical protein SAMN05192548_101738 [Paraburkholderia terricola]